MTNLAPVCPICEKNDELDFLLDDGKFYLTKYHCKRCNHTFDAKSGFVRNMPSVYQANESSISGSEYFVSGK